MYYIWNKTAGTCLCALKHSHVYNELHLGTHFGVMKPCHSFMYNELHLKSLKKES